MPMLFRPHAEAMALSIYGDLLIARGQLKQARDQYAAALAILRPLGEVPYVHRSSGHLRRWLLTWASKNGLAAGQRSKAEEMGNQSAQEIASHGRCSAHYYYL